MTSAMHALLPSRPRFSFDWTQVYDERLAPVTWERALMPLPYTCSAYSVTVRQEGGAS